MLPTLDDSEPVHGDLHTVDSLLAAHEVSACGVYTIVVVECW